MQQFNDFTLNIQDNTATLTFRWPEPAEMSLTLLRELTEAMDYIEDETTCHLLIFQGLGVTSVKEPQHKLSLDQYNKWEKCLQRIEHFSGASIACIQGICNGFHLQFMLACDLRLATVGSTFQSIEIKQGLLPGMSLFRLAKYINLGRARRFLFMSEIWKTDQACDLGLIDITCTDGKTDKALQDIHTSLSPIHPEVLRKTRRLLDESFATSFQDAIGHFLAAQNTCLFTQ